MAAPEPVYPIRELRVALTTNDYERLVEFYCLGLGIEPAQFWNNGQGRALILNMGRATLEIFDEAQAETIDEIEAGKADQPPTMGVVARLRPLVASPSLRGAARQLSIYYEAQILSLK